MKPALTAEEWKEAHRYMASAPDGAWGVRTNWDGEIWYDSSEDRHAAAAYALYGQTFGFTREDVELLKIARDAGRIDGGGGEPYHMAGRPLHFGEQVRLKELADRIEALLPPEG